VPIQRSTGARRPPPPRARRRPPRRRPDPRRRLEVILLLVLFVLTLVGGKLVQLQGLDRTAYTHMAAKQRLHTVTITAPRGTIVDRGGAPLAQTVDARDVYADPRHVVDAERTAAELGPLLGIKPAKLVPMLGRPTSYVPLAHAVTPALSAQIMDLELPGIGVLPTTRRVYPDGTLASNVVGFVHLDGSGAAGLEYSFQKILAGHDGARTFETGLSGSPIPDGHDVLTPAVPGRGLRLTLQRDVQWEAQQAITAQVRKVKADSGTVVVMDPRNGQILALAVAPGYDANAPTGTAIGANPAITEVYEPGSVNKVITMSAALQEGLFTPTSPISVPPILHYAGTTFHDAEGHGRERLTLTGVLAKSSNIGTIEVADRLQAPRLYHYLQAYGFGRPTGVGLPGEEDGLLPSLAAWSATTLPTVAFGQGIGVTALQVASVYATIANGGVRVTPNLVLGTTDASGHVHGVAAPAHRRVISTKVAHELSDMLEAVTTDQGTAPAARIDGYRIAGKTGTAQRPNGTGGYAGYTASFVGFAPADKPRLLVEVVLQNPRRGHFGGVVAAPVFHDVMAFALQTLGIAPTATRPPKARLTW
jgi:cell division protein FtsI (penicillin-binding protein 3)